MRTNTIPVRATSEHHAIDIWKAPLDVDPSCQTLLARLLSPEERERASAFRFDADHRRFIVARGTLRTLLGAYLERDPASLEFTYGPWGKPSLKGLAETTSLCFNLSHTSDLALYAITRSAPVGIDVERIHSNFSVEEIASTYFAQEEAALLANLPMEQRRESFYRIWTRKEAYCKARGQGLAQELQRIDVSTPPNAASEWFSIHVDGSTVKDLVLHDLEVGADYAAALALEGTITPEIVHLKISINCFCNNSPPRR